MRRVLISIVLLSVVVAAAVVVAVPTLISTQLVKTEIAGRIGAWADVSGAVGGRTAVTLFPTLGVEVKDVVLSGAPGAADEPLITAPSLKASLKLLPLLFGRTEVESWTLVEPKLRVVVKEGSGNWGVDCGRRIAWLGIASTGFGNVHRGDIILRDGTVTCIDGRTGSALAITNVNLDFRWPKAAAAAKLAGEFRWRDAQIEIDAQLDDPREAFAGTGSRVWARVAIESTLGLEKADIGSDHPWKDDRPDGDSDASPSTFGPIEISGELKAGERSLTLSEATVEAAGNTATGELSLEFGDERPVLIGSLAFGQLDLQPYVEKFMEVKPAKLLSLPLSAKWLGHVDVDLTAVADEVDLGLPGLSNTEVKLVGTDKRMTLTLTRAGMAGGRLAGRIIAAPAGTGVDLRVSGRFDGVSVDDVGDTVWQARFSNRLVGLGKPPGGKAKAQFELSGTGDTVGAVVASLDGWAVAALEDGSIDSVDVVSTLERLVDGNTVIARGNAPFIPVAGQTRIAWLTVHMEIESGVARAERMRLAGDRFEVMVSGEGDLDRGELEARGIAALFAAESGGGRMRPLVQLPFGVGGTMLAPVVVPGVPHVGHRSCDAPNPLVDNWCGLSRNARGRSNGD